MTSNHKTVLITVLATLGLSAVIFAAYTIGRQSGQSNTLAQVSIPTPSPESTRSPANQVANILAEPSNVSNNAVAALANASNTLLPKKPVSAKESAEEKRPLSAGYESGWTLVSMTSDSPGGYYLFYKPDSVKASSGSFAVWMRKFPMYPMKFAKRSELETPVDYAMQKVRFDCTGETVYVITETFFDALGSSIRGSSRQYQAEEVMPGTVMETAFKTVCEGE